MRSCIMGANAATQARGAGLTLATIVLQMLLSHVHAASSAAAVISKGDLLFLEKNVLLATSPDGVERTQIQLASLQPGPLDDDGFFTKRLIEVVYPGATSADGRFSFNPANFNRPVTKNTTSDKAVLVVTDLIEGKVKHSIELPLPGLPDGTYFNFQSNYILPANSNAEVDLGYTARKYVAAGSPVGDEYPLFLVVGAWSCEIYLQGNLSWSGVRQTIVSTCPKEDQQLVPSESYAVGLALGAADNTGYFITGGSIRGGPADIVVYKLNGKKLQKVSRQSTNSGRGTKLTLLGASAMGDSVIYAGVYKDNLSDNEEEIRLSGYAAANFSILSGFKVKPDLEYVSALANDAGALYALVRKNGGPSGSTLPPTSVYKVGPFALNVTGGKPTPTDSKQVFDLDPKWDDSIEVVGKPVVQLK